MDGEGTHVVSTSMTYDTPTLEEDGSVGCESILPVVSPAVREPVKVGDKLWFVPRSRYSEAAWVTITKVGRKWISAGGNRFDKTTLEADGGNYSSPGQGYRSQEEWAETVYLRKAWSAVSAYLRNAYGPPDGMSIDRLASIAAILGVPLPSREVEPENPNE